MHGCSMAETAREGMDSHGAGSVLLLAKLISRWLLFMVEALQGEAQKYVRDFLQSSKRVYSLACKLCDREIQPSFSIDTNSSFL